MTPFGWRLLGGPYPEIGTDRLTPLGWALAWLLVVVASVDVLFGNEEDFSTGLAYPSDDDEDLLELDVARYERLLGRELGVPPRRR